MQGTQLRYVIKFVADMDKAVKFHRDVLALNVKFESPGWSEFVTGGAPSLNGFWWEYNNAQFALAKSS